MLNIPFLNFDFHFRIAPNKLFFGFFIQNFQKVKKNHIILDMYILNDKSQKFHLIFHFFKVFFQG